MKLDFNEVWDHVKDGVRGYAFNQCSRDPEDPISKTMYALWIASENNKLNNLDHAKAYALKSIHCEVARWWSKSNRRLEVTEQYCEDRPESQESDAGLMLDIAELLEELTMFKCKVLEIAGKISDRHQRVMACKYEGMSYRETAKLCDVAKVTVGRQIKEVESEVKRQLDLTEIHQL